MHKGLIALATVASIATTVGIATPAAAQDWRGGYHHDRGGDRHDRWDHRDHRDWRRDHEWRHHHRHDGYSYGYDAGRAYPGYSGQ